MADDASDREQNPEATAKRTDASGEPEPNRGDEPSDGTAPEPRSGDPSGDGPLDGDGPPAGDGPSDVEPGDAGTVADAEADTGAGTAADAGTDTAADADANPGSEEDGRPAPSASADGRAAPAAEADQPASDPGADDRPELDGDDRSASETADQPMPSVPEDVRKYDRFKKMDGAQYDRVNEFLRARTYVTAREWAMARLCADFRTETGVEMTKIGENLPELVPFMTDTYTPQAVNQARASFEEKVRKAGATFLYGAMSDFLTADELDDLMYEVTEVAKFLLEVEGVDLSVEEELEAEERISSVMRDVRRSSDALRHDGMECPNCGHEIHAEE